MAKSRGAVGAPIKRNQVRGNLLLVCGLPEAIAGVSGDMRPGVLEVNDYTIHVDALGYRGVRLIMDARVGDSPDLRRAFKAELARHIKPKQRKRAKGKR